MTASPIGGAAAFERRELGVAVIGAGRMGTHRAKLAAAHPAVRFVGVSDINSSRARSLGETVGAQVISADAREVIERDDVTCVVVSSSEGEHVEPALLAIHSGKDVLVEKPLATSNEDAERIVRAAQQAGVGLHVGYSQRFRRNTFLSKRYVDDGRLGTITGGTARVYNSRAQAFQIMERSPHVSVIVDILTYWVDIFSWFMVGNRPVEVYAAGHGDILRSKAGPDGPDDLTNAIVRYEDGAVVSYSVYYAMPAQFPTMGQGVRLEVLGTDGVLLLDDDNRQNVVFSDHGIGHAYVPGHEVKMGYLGTTTSGDWALGTMFGPIADETRSWLDHLSTGSPTHVAQPGEAQLALAVTLAMEESSRAGVPVKIQ
jgi:predicted dehydrogenase